MMKMLIGALLAFCMLLFSTCTSDYGSMQPYPDGSNQGENEVSMSSVSSDGSAVSSVGSAVSSADAAVSATSAAVSSTGPVSGSASSSAATAISIPEVPAGEYVTLRSAEAKALIDSGDVTIVDVRTQNEYDAGHLPGAVLVTLDTIGTTQPEALPDLDATLLVYCRSGVRSAQASKALVKIGYTHVYNLDGGISAWPYETTTE